MSYECFREGVLTGRWSESGEVFETHREPQTRLWDRWMKRWVIVHGHIRHDEPSGPNPRYSRTEER